MSENIEAITSNREHKMLIYKQFKFNFAYTLKIGITKWGCYEKKYTAKIFTKNDYEFLKLEGNYTADHSAVDRRLIDRQIVYSKKKYYFK